VRIRVLEQVEETRTRKQRTDSSWLRQKNPHNSTISLLANENKKNRLHVPRSPLDDALAEEWVPQADVCVGAAPMFEERFALNDACVRHRKPLVNCAMYDTEATISTFAAGGQPCLRCIPPGVPDYWNREFPVFGATSGTVACIGAMEAIKLLSGFGKTLVGRVLHYDLRDVSFRQNSIANLPHCATCRSK
jgi:molybdopterin/thiamine biosynthesis adenylyltransferase